jgi:hypothetical protein
MSISERASRLSFATTLDYATWFRVAAIKVMMQRLSGNSNDETRMTSQIRSPKSEERTSFVRRCSSVFIGGSNSKTCEICESKMPDHRFREDLLSILLVFLPPSMSGGIALHDLAMHLSVNVEPVFGFRISGLVRHSGFVIRISLPALPRQSGCGPWGCATSSAVKDQRSEFFATNY